MYTWGVGIDGSTYDTWTQQVAIQSAEANTGKRFGHRIKTNDNGDILAVSSLGTRSSRHCGNLHQKQSYQR
jgi:hypothetical protein